MAGGGGAQEVAVRYLGGYSEKVRDLKDLGDENPVKAAEGWEREQPCPVATQGRHFPGAQGSATHSRRHGLGTIA